MIRRLAPLAVIVLMLPGCFFVGREGVQPWQGGLGPSATLANLEIFSVINTHKTVGDHIATWVTGRDCSTPRAQREGAWCVDWPAPPPPPQQVYCYASLAKPSCYSQPYNQGNDRLIGFVPAPLPIN